MVQKMPSVSLTKKNVAIFGGSFDPPSISHLQVASETINLLGFDEVWLVPCGHRPDKKSLSAPERRLKMVELAVADFFPPNFPVKISRIEIDHGESIPTMYLMDRFNMEHGDTHKFYFIMGSDLIKSLHWWDDGERMINTMRTIIFRRKGYNNDEIVNHPNFPKNDPIVLQEELSVIGVISSTEIRSRIAQNSLKPQVPHLGITGLVTPSVLNYIKDNQMYISPSAPIDLRTNDLNPVLQRQPSEATRASDSQNNNDNSVPLFSND